MKKIKKIWSHHFSRFIIHAKTGFAFAEESTTFSVISSGVTGISLGLVALFMCLCFGWWAAIFLWPVLGLTIISILACEGYIIRNEYGNAYADKILRKHEKDWTLLL